jgi:hypothetical protein
VDVRKITDQVNNRRAARYVPSGMRARAQQDGFRLVLAMDGVRNAIYAGKGLESYEVGRLNRLVGEIASELDYPPPRFARDLRRPLRSQSATFRAAYDWHCYVLANRLVGEAIARLLLRDPGLSAGPVQGQVRPGPARLTPAPRELTVQLRTPWLSNHSTRAVAAA